ncbi:Hsp20/alpha crystallin family protein [Candidatus Peregrinibacteria bacterium]|nr:MAG: Hsp20/alpha crystallin family protein [Candidatus Peregrinibacteria bacterium]
MLYTKEISVDTGEKRNTHTKLRTEEDVGYLALDVLETEETIFILAPIAGVEEGNLSISLNDDLLVISGMRVRPTFLPQESRDLVSECYWGSFSRHILLPSAVNTADMIARIEQGIIILEIPKARKAKSKIISLSSSQQ